MKKWAVESEWVRLSTEVWELSNKLEVFHKETIDVGLSFEYDSYLGPLIKVETKKSWDEYGKGQGCLDFNFREID